MSVTATLYSLTPYNFRFIKRFKMHPKTEAEKIIDLDKSWDVMSYVLTGSKGFTDNNILSEIIHPQENFRIGYIDEEGIEHTEIFSYISPDKVQLINKDIQKISKIGLKELFDKRDFDKIRTYPKRRLWSGEDNFSTIDFYFEHIKLLFSETAQEGHYVGITIDA